MSDIERATLPIGISAKRMHVRLLVRALGLIPREQRPEITGYWSDQDVYFTDKFKDAVLKTEDLTIGARQAAVSLQSIGVPWNILTSGRRRKNCAAEPERAVQIKLYDEMGKPFIRTVDATHGCRNRYSIYCGGDPQPFMINTDMVTRLRESQGKEDGGIEASDRRGMSAFMGAQLIYTFSERETAALLTEFSMAGTLIDPVQTKALATDLIKSALTPEVNS